MNAWNDYVGNILMMDPTWPPDVNTFVREDSNWGYFLRLDGNSLSRETSEAIVDCMRRHGFNATIARYGGWTMTTNSDKWRSLDVNKTGYADTTSYGIIDGLMLRITDKACQPDWD